MPRQELIAVTSCPEIPRKGKLWNRIKTAQWQDFCFEEHFVFLVRSTSSWRRLTYFAVSHRFNHFMSAWWRLELSPNFFDCFHNRTNFILHPSNIARLTGWAPEAIRRRKRRYDNQGCAICLYELWAWWKKMASDHWLIGQLSIYWHLNYWNKRA